MRWYRTWDLEDVQEYCQTVTPLPPYAPGLASRHMPAPLKMMRTLRGEEEEREQ